ncbi:MAG: NADH-quinone oxidoreductase subunit J [Acidobacteria bacterium]|jgi:NADH-quinone oxidoreductase subunit J|nr:NADH-quinone oxidoreductase subunit J [Acidobacteriota bacterium]
MMIDAVLFYVFAAIAVASAVVVIGQRNPMYSAFALVVTLCSVAVIFGLLGSPFIAVLQVIVYAGAIMVLFLFVLMLLNVKREKDSPSRGQRTLSGVALALVTVLVLQAGAVLLRSRPTPAPDYDASTFEMAKILFSPHFLYAFEATSILILAALVGAVVLAKKEL